MESAQFKQLGEFEPAKPWGHRKWRCYVCGDTSYWELVSDVAIIICESGRSTWCCGAACALAMLQELQRKQQWDTDVDLERNVHPYLELSARSRKALQVLGIHTVKQLVTTVEADLLVAKNFGSTSLCEIKRQLAARGLTLKKQP